MRYFKGEFTVVPSKSARRGLPPAQQVVYMWLCDYANDDMTSFPSRKTIAADCGMSVRSVDAACMALEKKGLISKQQRYKGGEKTTSLYTVNIVEPERPGGSAESAPPSAKIGTTPRAKSAHRTQPIPNSTHQTQSAAKASGPKMARGGGYQRHAPSTQEVMDALALFDFRPTKLPSNVVDPRKQTIAEGGC